MMAGGFLWVRSTTYDADSGGGAFNVSDLYVLMRFFFFSSRRRHTRFDCDWSSDVCSSDLNSHKFSILYHGQPSDLPLIHQFRSIRNTGSRLDRDNWFRHSLTNSNLRRQEILGRDSLDNVPFRNYPNSLSLLA